MGVMPVSLTGPARPSGRSTSGRSPTAFDRRAGDVTQIALSAQVAFRPRHRTVLIKSCSAGPLPRAVRDQIPKGLVIIMIPTNDRPLELSRPGAGFPPIRYTGPAFTGVGFAGSGFTEIDFTLVKLIVVEYDAVWIPVLDLTTMRVTVVKYLVARVTVRRIAILRTTVVEYTPVGCYVRECVTLKYLREEYTRAGYDWVEYTAQFSAMTWRAW